jgi:hypothetical protein
MRVFKSKWFSHFAEKEAVSNDDLKALVEELEEGYVYAILGVEFTNSDLQTLEKEEVEAIVL